MAGMNHHYHHSLLYDGQLVIEYLFHPSAKARRDNGWISSAQWPALHLSHPIRLRKRGFERGVRLVA